MLYQECAPSPALRPYVRCYWVVRIPAVEVARIGLQRVLPDGCMDIILARRGAERDGREAFSLTAVGAMTRYLDAIPLPLRVGVRFEPGMGPLFLRASATALTDAEVPLGELLGEDAARLLAEVAATRSIPGRIHTLERWLLRRLDRATGFDADVLSVVARIVSRQSGGPVGPLVRTSERSERHLRRRFEAAVGIGPKRLARIVRLQDALRRAASETGGWAQIAADAGYYDQAHMITEFRALTGRTPVELVGARP